MAQLWRWVITAYFVFRSFFFSFSTRPILQTEKKMLKLQEFGGRPIQASEVADCYWCRRKKKFNYIILPLRLTCQDWLFSFCQHIVVQTWELADQSHSDPVWTTAALLRSTGCEPSWQAPGNRGDCGTTIYIYFGSKKVQVIINLRLPLSGKYLCVVESLRKQNDLGYHGRIWYNHGNRSKHAL